jgi:hypothetical protein
MKVTIDIPDKLMESPFEYITLTLQKNEGHITKVNAPLELSRVALEFKEGESL